MHIRLATIAALIGVLVLGLGALEGPVLGAANPRFLRLPFASGQRIIIQRAWITRGSTGKFDLVHHAVDYINGTQDVVKTWKTFEVLAAAEGEACGARQGQGGCFDSGEIMGNRVLIKHKVQGQVYYTFYNHLDSIAKGIPLNDKNKTVHVAAGEKIGMAGASNSQGLLHLHWELLDSTFKPLDPYGIYGISDFYPDPRGKNGRRANKSYFIDNPPLAFGATGSPSPSPGSSTGPGGSVVPSASPAATSAASLQPGPSGPTFGQSPSPGEGTPAPSPGPAATLAPADGGLGTVPVAVGIGALVVGAVLLGLTWLSRRRRRTLSRDRNWRP